MASSVTGSSVAGSSVWERIARSGNCLLFVLLVGLIGWQAPESLTARLSAPSQNADRTLSNDASGDVVYWVSRGSGGWSRDVLIEFSGDVVTTEHVGEEAADGLIRLEPDVPLTATWVSRSKLRVRADSALPRARRVHVHFDVAALDLEALVGRPVRALAPERLWVETAPVRVISATATEHDENGIARAIVVACDLDLDDEDFERSVSVREIDADGEDGDELALRVERIDAPGEHVWRLALPEGPLPDNVLVRVEAGLAPPSADVALGQAWVRTLTLRPELLVTSLGTYDDGLLVGLNHTVPLPREGFLSLDPPIDFQIHRRRGDLRLYGDFIPGSTYRVTFHAGFPGAGPARLRKETVRSVRLPDADPELAFPDRGSVLSSIARHEIAIESINVQRLEVAARTVYANNVVRLAQDKRASDVVFGPWVRTEIAVAGTRNEKTIERIALDDLLGKRDDGSALGLHEIRIRDLDNEARAVRRLVQITDLGTTVRATRDAIAVRVASIAYARPVAGAEVMVRTPTNQTLCRGVTGADGTVVLRYPARDDDRVPFLIEVSTATDRTFVDLNGFEVALADEAQSGRPYLRGGFECHVYPDRGAVRPGETARVTIVGRSARGVSAVGADVEVRWFGPDRRLRRSERMPFGDSGLLVAEHATSTADATGAWRVEVVDVKSETVTGRASFLVEAFVPDRIEAAVEIVGTPTLGSAARLRVRASWLEGSPAEGRPFRASVRLDHLRWRPDGFAEFSFAALHDGEAQAPPGNLPVVKGVLGDDGEVDVVVSIPGGSASGKAKGAVQGYRATVRVEVSDPSGRPVRAGLVTDVLRDGPLLGARADDETVEVALVMPDGSLHDGQAPVNVTLERRHWEWRTRRRGSSRSGRRYVWESYVVAEPAGTLSGTIVNGRATLTLPELRTFRDWIVAVVRSDVEGDSLRADARIGSAIPRPDRLRVEGPNEPVHAGDEIELTIASPTAGTAFITFESTTIDAVLTADVARGHDTLRVVVPEHIEGPNVHVVVTLVAPQARADATPPYWIVGATSLRLAADDLATVVTIDAPEVVLPESDVELLIDAPGATHATVALIDEGVLRVTGHLDPDPIAFFRARRRLETQGADTGTRLMERPGYDPDTLDGGDEGSGSAIGARLEASTSAVIETVALFQGPVRLDPEGRARVTFTLPPYEGRLRAVVIAAGSSRVGAASAEVTVRAPLGLRIAAPRRLTPGDVSTATVTVRNGTGVEASVSVNVAASQGVELRGDAQRQVVLADGKTLSFDVELVATGLSDGALIAVNAVCGDQRREVEVVVPVQPAGLFETRRVGLHLAADGSLTIPGKWAPGTRTARLVIAPGVGADLLPALEALLRYPHGCVEQTSSRAHAVLACRPLLKELAPDAAERADDMIVQGIARLRSMQMPRGGMSFWPGGRNEVDLGSLVALDFLLDARDQGFDVDEKSLRRLVRRVGSRLAARPDASFRAMAVEILSRGGGAVGRWLPNLVESVKRPEDRARVALALARIGDVAAAQALLAEASGGSDDIPVAVAETGGLLFSPTRERAFLLRALLEVAPKDRRIDVLADALRADVLAPARLTTQSQSHAVRALSALHLRDLQDTPDVRGSVFVDDVEYPVDGRTEIDIPAAARGNIRVALSRRSRALLAVRGVRIDIAPVDDDGEFRIARRLIDVETGRAPTKIRRGGAYDVILEVGLADTASNLLLTDILPAGMEAESPRHGVRDGRRSGERLPDHVDVRDDRVLLHLDGPIRRGTFSVRYRVHATFPGRYAVAPPVIEALYKPGSMVRGRSASDGVEIVR